MSEPFAERHIRYFASKDPVEGGKFAVGREFEYEPNETGKEWTCKELKSMKMAEEIAKFLEHRRSLNQPPFDE